MRWQLKHSVDSADGSIGESAGIRGLFESEACLHIYLRFSSGWIIGMCKLKRYAGFTCHTRSKNKTRLKMGFRRNITIMDSKKTAYGNLILATDKGAVVDPRFKETEIAKIPKPRRRSGADRNRGSPTCSLQQPQTKVS